MGMRKVITYKGEDCRYWVVDDVAKAPGSDTSQVFLHLYTDKEHREKKEQPPIAKFSCTVKNTKVKVYGIKWEYMTKKNKAYGRVRSQSPVRLVDLDDPSTILKVNFLRSAHI